MCRFVAYIGDKPLLLEEILVSPENSLVKQSRHATRDQYKVNADGFGMSWYNFKADSEPAIFKSIQPAWNDDNLKHIARTVESQCFIGHIRASTIGDVSRENCHPFAYKEFSMVHNGNIDNFNEIRRLLLKQLSDEYYLAVKGNTDSECLFFLIMEYVYAGKGMSLIEAVKKAFKWVKSAQKAQGKGDYSRINIVISSGHEMIATRFVSKGDKALSLTYSKETETSVVVASEPIDYHVAEWTDVPVNHYVHIKNDANSIDILSLEDI
jgi:glutamine amidotransferase